MAIVEAQAWACFANADEEGSFDRQQNWNANADALYTKAAGPNAAGAWSSESNSEYLEFDNSLGLSTLFGAWYFEFNPSQLPRYHDLLHFYEGSFATRHCYLSLYDTGTLLLANNGGGLLAKANRPVNVMGINHIAFKVVIHDTTGSVDVELNGNSIMSETGLDTRNGGASGIIDSLRLESESQYNYRHSNFILWSGAGDAPTDFFGMHNVHMIKPDGDTSVQFTPQGAGAGYVEVDEQAADDDTTYNESATVTNKDEFTTESLPTKVKTVYSVQAKALVKDPDGTATESVKVGLNSGTESLSAAQALSTGYEIFEGPLETVDPNTASAWTEANVNGTDVVYEHA